MDTYSTFLKSCGMKITPQRVWVYRIVKESGTHLSVDEVYQQVKQHIPAISRATVYTTLELLEGKGLLREIKIDFERSFYEAETESHHHFLCRTCKKIFDIHMNPCPALTQKEIEGHTIADFHGYFYGVCRECGAR